MTVEPSSAGGEARRILVGVDGGSGGADALELARVAGGEEGASLTVATVLFSGPLPIDLGGLDPEDAAAAAPIFERAREALAGLPVETRAIGGGTPGEILTVLAERESF